MIQRNMEIVLKYPQFEARTRAAEAQVTDVA
jgi:hypothetical protein